MLFKSSGHDNSEVQKKQAIAGAQATSAIRRQVRWELPFLLTFVHAVTHGRGTFAVLMLIWANAFQLALELKCPRALKSSSSWKGIRRHPKRDQPRLVSG